MNHNEDKPGSKDQRVVMIPLMVAVTLIISTLSIVGGVSFTAIWWASDISSKMSTVLKNGDSAALRSVTDGNRITALELWQRAIDSSGSPTVRTKIEEVAKEINSLRRDIDIMKSDEHRKP
jgi:hypothetical protein